MATQKNTNVYLEAVEVAENKSEKLNETRNGRMAGIPKRKHSKGLLGYCGKWYINAYHNKQKTCTPRIL